MSNSSAMNMANSSNNNQPPSNINMAGSSMNSSSMNSSNMNSSSMNSSTMNNQPPLTNSSVEIPSEDPSLMGGSRRRKLRYPLNSHADNKAHEDFYCVKCSSNRRRHRSDKTISYKKYDIKMRNGKTRESYMLFSECDTCKNSLPKIVSKDVALKFPQKVEGKVPKMKKEKVPKMKKEKVPKMNNAKAPKMNNAKAPKMNNAKTPKNQVL